MDAPEMDDPRPEATFVADDVEVAELALASYDISPESRLRLLNLSENATYAVEDATTGDKSILRVHRKDYHRRHEIESELDWLEALRRDSDVTVPTVLPTRDGQRVVTVEHDGTARHVVHFDMVAGVEPDEETLTVHDFHTLGCITASLHDHSRSWTRPQGFGRFSWDWQHSLVHADLRLANLLVDGDTITVIDFDDCGFGWYFYDFGTAVSFFEDDPAVPEWQEAWVSGYRSRRPLAPSDEAMLPSFVLLRRLLLLAWMGSHSHSRESQAMSITYAEGSCALAERYLTFNGQRLA